MKLDSLLVLVSIAMSCTAVTISVAVAKRNPFGTDISKYDFSSPENTLKSINAIIARQDLRAAWQLTKRLLEDSADRDAKLFLSDTARITVLKSIEVSNSANPKNNGTIVSFVKVTVSGVDYYTVQTFRKDQSNRFFPGGSSFVAYGTEKSDQDKALESAVEEFKKSGKL